MEFSSTDRGWKNMVPSAFSPLDMCPVDSNTSVICLKIFRFFASFVEMLPEDLEIKRTVSTEKEP
jgi:hypothetical protein